LITRAQAVRQAVDEMKNAGFLTPQLDAEVILCHLLHVDRIQLHMYPEKEISPQMYREFWNHIEKRLKHMPVQYITQKQEFMGLDFYVNEHVLIPRGDTEILVETVIEMYQKMYAPNKVKALDLGTGSGVIAVSLAKCIEPMEVTATDISSKALETAKINASRHNVEEKITFLEGSLLNPLKGKDQEESFDFLLSNPPYISHKTLPTLSSQVKDYEPLTALDGGEDGLDFYRCILKEGLAYLNPAGWLIMEIGCDQGAEVKKLMEKSGLKEIKVIKDLAGLDRVITGRK
jgi:release factor glutamine methyltransferase